MENEHTDQVYKPSETRPEGFASFQRTILQSDTINELAAALAKAQGAIENPSRNRTVDVETRAGGGYSFSYCTLDTVMDAIRKPLSDNGLAYTQMLGQSETGRYVLTTRLLHSSGQWIASETPLFVDERSSQKFGSALTFMRRYALTALVGVAAEEDDDANAADGNAAQVKERKPKPAAPEISAPPKVVADIIPDRILSRGWRLPVELAVGLTKDNKSDWLSWGSLYISALKTAQSKDDLEEWILLNTKHVDRMEQEAPKVHKRLTDAVWAIHQEMEKNDAAEHAVGP